MTFSFTIQAPTKQEAKAAVAAKVDELVAAQPDHERDAANIKIVAYTYIDLLEDDPGTTVHLNAHGWITQAAGRMMGAQIHVTAHLVEELEQRGP